MNKLTIVAALAALGTSAFAAEPQLEKEDGQWNNWRITVGGFGRGNMKTTLKGMGDDRVTAYGVDLDVQYNIWQNENFNIWGGIGGTFCPSQNVSGGFGTRSSESTHEVSEDGSTTVDFDSSTDSRADVELGYGEFRMMLVPEWKVTDAFALGFRAGVAFDWINAKTNGRQDWNWNQHTVIDIPPYVHEVIDLGDAGSSGFSDSQTEFAAQAILGLQATYMFTDWVGLYANFDWRLGGETDFKMANNQELSVDMSGWYWGVGAVVSF